MYDLLSTLDVTKANGHDDISATMLKKTAMSITPVITELFNTSIRLGEIPDEWKVARVTPIPKGGNASDPGNYRPMSLLSILSKLLEKHVRNLLVKHFEEHCPFSVQQWGFTPGKSIQLGHYWLQPTIGLAYWIKDMTFVLCFSTTARLLIWYLTAYYCKNSEAIMLTNTFSDGLHIILVTAHSICLC